MLEDKELDELIQADESLENSDLPEVQQVIEPSDDKQLMMEMLAKMQELTDEVNSLRQQLKDSSSRTASLSNQDDRTEDFYTGLSTDDDEALKVLRELSEQENTAKSKNKNKKNKGLTVVSNIVFYTLILALVFGAFLIRSSKNDSPWMLGGYSAMKVLTGSMEDVYPQGSLIITKSVDPQKLNIGDDITYMTGETTSITHRIIGITENYLDTNERGFETKGVMNENPDKEIVSAANVVGRVVFCSKTLGDIATFITNNWPLLLFLIFVIIVLLAFLKWNSRREKHSSKDKIESDEFDSKSENIRKTERSDADSN